MAWSEQRRPVEVQQDLMIGEKVIRIVSEESSLGDVEASVP